MEKKKECRVTTRGKVKTVDGFRGPRHAAGMIFWVMYLILGLPSRGPMFQQ